ncbi:MAG: hypothetical protein AB9836_08420 [Aminipila sp.]
MKNFDKFIIITIIAGIIGIFLIANLHENKIIYLVSVILILHAALVLVWDQYFKNIQPLRLSIALSIIAITLSIVITYIIYWLKIVPDHTGVVLVVVFYLIVGIITKNYKKIEVVLNKFIFNQ